MRRTYSEGDVLFDGGISDNVEFPLDLLLQIVVVFGFHLVPIFI